MASLPDEPHPDDIIILGALSQAPEDDEASTTSFDFATSLPDILGSATASVINASASVYAFQGLAAVRSETTLIAQVAGRAIEIDDFNPPVWYLNFPLKMNDAALQNLRDHAQTMHDFKCWLSMKWWSNVFQMFPTDLGILNKMIQSAAFVQVAMKELPQSPIIIDLAMRNFQSLDEQARNAIEPVLQGIVQSASTSTTDYTVQKMVLAEKHEYLDDQRILSTLRQICFSIGESFYDVQEGKNSSRRWVKCQVGFVQYEGLFDIFQWRQVSGQINKAFKDSCEDFISRRTIDVPVSDDDTHEAFQPSVPFSNEDERLARMIREEESRFVRSTIDVPVD
ncbi:hypothetical protein ACHAPQ_008732 [Fusarium lateritium]